MSTLDNTRKYELSVWEDQWLDGQITESRIAVISSDDMISQAKAFEINFKRGTNGKKSLSFKLPVYYFDVLTGQQEKNFFCSLLDNETKVKLHYEDKWYEFIVKNVQENSQEKSNTYQLEDFYVNELSKNGYDVVLDPKMPECVGNAVAVGGEIMKGSGWTVKAEKIYDLVEDFLVELTLNATGNYSCKQINGKLVETLYAIDNDDNPVVYYAFYSQLKSKPKFFNFLLDPNENNVIDGILSKEYSKTVEYYLYDQNYIEATIPNLGMTVYIPDIFTVGNIRYDIKAYYHNFSPIAVYDPVFDRYVYQFTSAEEKEVYYGFETTTTIVPEFVQNLLVGTDWTDINCWKNSYIADDKNKFEGEEKDCKIEIKTDPEITFAPLDTETEYTTYLSANFQKTGSCLTNRGIYENRQAITNFKNGDRYILMIKFRGSAPENLSYYIGNNTYNATVGHYVNDITKIIDFKETSPAWGDYVVYTGTVEGYNVTDEQFLKEKNLFYIENINIDNNPTTTEIQDIQLFKYYPKNDKKGYSIDNAILPVGLTNNHEEFLPITTTEWHYYEPNQNVESADQYIYQTTKPKGYDFKYNMNAEKIRSISVSKSNYYNALQKLAEVFDCWIDLDITHNDDGTVDTKTIVIKNYLSNYNPIGFKYGANLNSIQRTIDSKQIVSKLYVTENTNEVLENGFCSIANATNNPSGENYILNFDYYIGQGMLDKADVDEILWQQSSEIKVGKLGEATLGDFHLAVNSGQNNTQGFYAEIGELNRLTKDLDNQIVPLKQALTENQAKLDAYEKQKEAAAEEYEESWEKFIAKFFVDNKKPNITFKNSLNCNDFDKVTSLLDSGEETWSANGYEYKCTGTWTEGSKKYYSCQLYGYKITNSDGTEEVSTIEIPFLIPCDYSDISFYSFTPKDSIQGEYFKNANVMTATFMNTDDSSISEIVYLPENFFEFKDSNRKILTNYKNTLPTSSLQNAYTKCSMAVTQSAISYKQAEQQMLIYSPLVQSQTEQLTTLEDERDTLNNLKKEVRQKFYKKMSRYIQEGTWSDNEAYSNEEYYINAQSVSNSSAFPKVTYNFNVFDLSTIPGYEDFKIELGETTWVEDPEFFGYSSTDVPKREEVIVTEKTSVLDDASKDSIQIKNYRNNFQDLFQKITATTQTVQEAKSGWSAAASFTNGTPDEKLKTIQDALHSDKLTLKNANVYFDDEGLVIEDAVNKARKLRLAHGAIEASTPEGNYTTLLTKDGMFANHLRSGSLDTGVLQIMSKNSPSHRWDENGITAFGLTDNNTYDLSRGVRFDRLGIYGFKLDSGESAITWIPENEDDVEGKATFALTSKGLFFDLGDGEYYAEIEDNGTKKPYGIISHSNRARIGIHGKNQIYNTWEEEKPTFVPGKEEEANFVPIFTAGRSESNPEFQLYDDGTVICREMYFTDKPATLYYKHESSEGNFTIPKPDKFYIYYPELSTGWHKQECADDTFKCHTTNGGRTWEEITEISSNKVYAYFPWSMNIQVDQWLIIVSKQVTCYDVDTPIQAGDLYFMNEEEFEKDAPTGVYYIYKTPSKLPENLTEGSSDSGTVDIMPQIPEIVFKWKDSITRPPKDFWEHWIKIHNYNLSEAFYQAYELFRIDVNQYK